ncbi:hypothetical protein EYV96_14200 [Dyella terrae]|uniref:Cobalamin ABC transporter n=3 Tax=Rhodanobacteraceae TaxID=1775411 RepID=A0A4R0YS29_9GAMM|nr:hypothetical protein EYV96_14200 [Dyella terrae]TCI08693.1 hypothetical protein EZM97_24670 [Dyella soli]
MIAACVLALLMILTRGQHFASVNALPSASWAVFFLAGALVRTRWLFVFLFALASMLDLGSLAAGTITDWCLSPAYWVLVPAYGTLWFAGRLYGRKHVFRWSTVPRLAITLVVAAFATYLISGGGYYAFSGHYEPTFMGFLPRIAHYYPRSLGTMSGYVAVGFLVLSVVRVLAPRLSAAPSRVHS